MASSLRGWMFPAATGLAGFVAGILIAGLVGAGAGAPPAPVIAIERAPIGLTTDDVRRVVREELVARDSVYSRAPIPADKHAVTDSVVAAAPTESQTAAGRQAESIVAGAISRRTWTEADAESLREVFHDMSAEQQSETLRQFAVAVNQGRLSPQTNRIPF